MEWEQEIKTIQEQWKKGGDAEELLSRLRRLYDAVLEEEPPEDDEEAYAQFEERLEDMDDLMDELLDAMEE